MIKDKHNKPQTEESTPPVESVPEKVSENPFVNMYDAVRRAILTVREDPDDPTSPPLFKTIAIDNGQFTRLIRSENLEYEIAFPASYTLSMCATSWHSSVLARDGQQCECVSFSIRSITQM